MTVQAVPEIDHADSYRQVDPFVVAEMLLHRRIEIIRHMRFGDLRHGLGPGQRSALALREKPRLAPGRQAIRPLLGFAAFTGFEGVHVQTEGTALDLRNADLDQRAGGHRAGLA